MVPTGLHRRKPLPTQPRTPREIPKSAVTSRSRIPLGAPAKRQVKRPQATLSTCPSVVYREIARYLAPSIILECDLKAYLTLQHCCNPIFARAVRSVIKEKLQYVQAALALRTHASVVRNPCVLQNPMYAGSLTFERLCDVILASNQIDRKPTSAAAKILLVYAEGHCGNLVPISGTQYPLHTFNHIVRVEETFALGGAGSCRYKLSRGAELCTLGNGSLEKFDWAFRLPLHDPMGGQQRQIMTLASRNGKSCFVIVEDLTRSVLIRTDGITYK